MAASSAATTRVRSTTRARRLLVPRASTDEALVRMAGATMAVSTANGLPAPLVVYCTATLYPPLVRSARFLHGNFALQQIMAIYVSARLGSAFKVTSARIPARNREYAAAAIIAALSVESARLGKKTSTPAALARSSNVMRNWLLAATPPDTRMLSTASPSAAVIVRSTSPS